MTYLFALLLVFLITFMNTLYAHDFGDSEPEIRTGSISKEVLIQRLTEFEGYSQIIEINRQGTMYKVTAIKDGEMINVQIDSLIGTIFDARIFDDSFEIIRQ